MNEFDQNIVIVSDNIYKNIASIADNDRGFVSQNILNSLRNLVEAVDQRIYSEHESITLNKYADIERAVTYVASRGNLRFLERFHYYLQAAASHFTPDEDGATRLMLKYYEWLLRIRDYTKKSFGLDMLNARAAGFQLLECETPGHSMIRFSVGHYVDDDVQEKQSDEVVPFQVAYAISIHKAQGLEYNSVKVIVTNEIEELITHNIFYTAITRARKKLKIYWTPETQHKILSSMKPISCKRDAYMLANKYGILIQNKAD